MGLHIPNGVEKGALISSGKTKEIYEVRDASGLVIMKNNDNISAGDGARMEQGQGKAELSTTITANVFEYLNSKGIKTHYKERLESDEILVEKCDMVPIECVFRFVATGSYIKREKAMKGDNAIEDGTVLDSPIIELYYKNDVKLKDGTVISDPMILLGDDELPVLDDNGGFVLLDPKSGERLELNQVREAGTNQRILIDDFRRESFSVKQISDQLLEQTRVVGEGVKSLYAEVGVDTFDGKVEFGLNQQGALVLADVIDGDSCRLRVPYVVKGDDGKDYLAKPFLPGELDGISEDMSKRFRDIHVLPEGMGIKQIILAEGLDKQGFREGESVDDTLLKYKKLTQKSSEALKQAQTHPTSEVVDGVKTDCEGIIEYYI